MSGDDDENNEGNGGGDGKKTGEKGWGGRLKHAALVIRLFVPLVRSVVVDDDVFRLELPGESEHLARILALGRFG